MTSNDNEAVAWLINGQLPYRVIYLRNKTWPRYSANGNNLIVKNIMINDDRNNSNFSCVIVSYTTDKILNESEPTFLYVAGKY